MSLHTNQTVAGKAPASAGRVEGGRLQVEGLEKHFRLQSGKGEAVKAVDGVSFEVEPGSMFTLLGPSGCGKTTTLRSVAGLEDPDGGAIRVGDRTLFSSERGIAVPPDERNLGMVFQSYAIWPHMTVGQNLSFPLRARSRRVRPSSGASKKMVSDALEVVQLGHLRDRPATDLSGGQQQRLALARALVMRPPLLLLDEPLSNLDAGLREEMRVELKRLQRSLGITALYVTHDQVEALAMSRQIAVMNAGRIQQVGTPREIYDRPTSHFVANFIGSCNFLHATIKDRVSSEEYLVEANGTVLSGSSATHRSPGEQLLLAVRPENVEIRRAADAAGAAGDVGGQLRGVVLERAFLGEAMEHYIDCSGTRIRSRGHGTISFAPGTELVLSMRTGTGRLVEADKQLEGKRVFGELAPEEQKEGAVAGSPAERTALP